MFTMTSGTGTCSVMYNQAGDSNYNAAPQVTETVNAQKASSTTTVSSSVNPSDGGQNVTFTATVTSGATGTVTFKDNGSPIAGCSNRPLTSGQATCDTATLATGNHPITADYSGDSNFATSTGTLAGGQDVNVQTSVSVTAAPASMDEDDPGGLIYTFTRSGSTSSSLTINFSVSGTADFGTDYTQTGAATFGATSGTVTFTAGNSTATVTIDPTTDLTIEPDETVILTVTSGANYLLGTPASATTTILNDDADYLLLYDESGPGARQAAAVDSILFMRDPFRVISVEDWFPMGPDRNTRVLLFLTNFQLNQGDTALSVVVNLTDSNGQVYDIPAEDVRPVANTPFMQVMFRLPNGLPSGTCTVRIKAHGQIGNKATFRIQ
jgi:hypothetical protein